jgi:hypothetical protein
MRALSATELIAIWERGTGSTPVGQALAMLRVAFPETPSEILAQLDIAQRDAFLLRLRSLTFGTHFKGLTTCQACGQQLELDLNTSDLGFSNPPLPDVEIMNLASPGSLFQLEDYEVIFRLPNSIDLQALEGENRGLSARGQLLDACILSTLHDEKEITVSELPSQIMDALIDHMSQISSLADLTVSVHCPNCGHAWEILFDIVSFFWGEISAWAARLMREVHILAVAYGWREADILSMSAFRRQQYLELIGAQ